MARLICWLLVASAAQPQPAANPLRFEVASIKPSGSQSVRMEEGGPGSSDPQLYTFGRVTLQDLIAIANEVRSFQISSKVSLDKDEFDLAARVPAGTTKPQFRSMLRNLLAERFHLKLHVISKEFPAYALVVARGGPNLRGSAAQGVAFTDPPPRQLSGDGFPALATNRPDIGISMSGARGSVQVRLSAHQEPISVLALMLRAPDNQPVVDQPA